VLIALIAIAVKVVLGLTAATVVGLGLNAVFGGPFEKLPGDQQQQLQTRFDAAVGDGLRNLSDAEAATKVQSMEFGGLPRLDDATLVDYESIWSEAIAKADPAACADAAKTRSGAISKPTTDKILSSLDTTRLVRWFDIEVSAIAASAKGAPAARTVSQAASDEMTTALLAKLSSADVATLQAMSGSAEASGSPAGVSDTAACTAYADYYAAGMALDPTNQAVFALSDVSP
jgi:hypothetical protein